MIIHKLIAQHLSHKDDEDFYRMQARDAIEWIKKQGVALGRNVSALDLGCGHGVLGSELIREGCQVTFSDEKNFLNQDIVAENFVKFNIDQDQISTVGRYDLVICSNVLEHLSKPDAFLKSAHELLTDTGVLYLSWTNWLSPWGGHEFSPFHYLGSRRGHLIYDKIIGRKRNHTPYVDLFPTYIGATLGFIRRETELAIIKTAPRYYPEFAFITALPGLREFLTWNCAVLLQRKK